MSWKYSLSTADEAPPTAPILLTGNINDNLIQASKLGYNAIEIHTRPDENFDYYSIREEMNKHDIQISAIITGRLNTEGQCNLIDDRPYIIESAMQGMYQYIDMAAKLNTDIVLGWAKGNIPHDKNRNKYLQRLAHNLSKLADYAAERKVKIHAEVINHYEVNIFTTAKETMDFIKQWHLQNIYVHLDTFHMNIEETDPIKAIQYCKKHLGYFHLADNTRSYPGSGQIPFPHILKTLKNIGYDGYLSVECLPGNNRQQTAKLALDYLKSI